MFVSKRSGSYEAVDFNKITERIKKLSNDLAVDPIIIARETITKIVSGIKTSELDNISASVADSRAIVHPDYGRLAGRLLASNHHKETPAQFSDGIRLIEDICGPEHFKFIMKHADVLNGAILHERDFEYSAAAWRTLEYSYLHKRNGRLIDRPQYMLMRVAIAIYMGAPGYTEKESMELILNTYRDMAHRKYIHASPTLFNSCTKNMQMLSCFLFGTADMAEEINRSQTNAVIIAKHAGGLGGWMHCIRPQGSLIKSAARSSSGLPKQLKIYESIAINWNQGGRREGAIAIYLEPWHADISAFLAMRHNIGDDSQRARKLYYALWIPELFNNRVQENATWSLFDPVTAPGLSDVYDGMQICAKCDFCHNRNWFNFRHGVTHPDKYCTADGEVILMRETNNGEAQEAAFKKYVLEHTVCTDGGSHTWVSRDMFTELYTKYEKEGRAVRKCSAQQLALEINATIRESGMPYRMNKDAVNRRSPQRNIGTIKSSNLCTEITLWTSEYSYANCTLASIKLDTHMSQRADGSWEYNFVSLRQTTANVVRNLDRIIDISIYPVKECLHNKRNFRPIGVGVQGLADVFCKMRVPFISDAANELAIRIAENIYYAAVESSCELAERLGAYPEFAGSPASMGKLQPDLWADDIARRNVDIWGDFKVVPMLTLDWDSLRARVMKYGLRNSCVVAWMPTVSTSQILDSCESFEPFNSCVFVKTSLSGKLTRLNEYMVRHLIEAGYYNANLVGQLYTNGGSLMAIDSIPIEIREIYRTAYEIRQKDVMRIAAIMGAFVDQSMSLNIHLPERSDAILNAVSKHGFELGLKTISYYTRANAAVQTSGISSFTFKDLFTETNQKMEAEEDTPCESCTA